MRLKEIISDSKIKIVVSIISVAIGVIFLAAIGYHYLKKKESVYSYKTLIGIEKKSSGKNESIILKDLKIAQKRKPPYNFTPVGTFKGQLKKHGTIKIVFGVAGKRFGAMKETVGNIYFAMRYLNLHKIPYKIAVV
ncbi:MAG: hypothetical protein ACYDDE_03885, partial [bacterium]